VISGSVSGVADGAALVGCDAVPDASKGRIASTFRVKRFFVGIPQYESNVTGIIAVINKSTTISSN